jgi:hypothetical protein
MAFVLHLFFGSAGLGPDKRTGRRKNNSIGHHVQKTFVIFVPSW